MNRAKRTAMALGSAALFFWLAVVLFQRGTPPAHAYTQQTPQAPTEAGSPVKRALLIGINNYKYPDRISPLAGSLNDVEDMRQVLIGKFEFAPENILVLKDAQATHAGIMSAIHTHLIDTAKPGDIIVIHYSGHGSQMKDVTGKMPNGLDESIVPYDSRDPEGRIFDISGAEFHNALAQLAAKTRNITVILDSCNSGTLVRGARVRSIPADTRDIPPAVATAMRGVSAIPAESATPRFAFISAATSKENAFEQFADGHDHGALTYFLTRQLRAARAGATYRDIMDPVIANVTAYFPGQHPALEGAEADQHVFADGSSLAGTYVPASPSLLDPHHVTLSIGQAEGATVGSTFDVYAPGTKKFASPERPTGRVQLLTVTAFTSEASILPGGKVAPSSRAVEREHRYTSSRARVFLDGVDTSPTLQQLQSALAKIRYAQQVDRPTLCNIQLRQVGPNILILAADATKLSTPVAASDPQAVNKLLQQLQMWAKWYNVLSIRNPQNGIDVTFKLAGQQTRDPVARVGKPDMGVTEGDEITATLANNSDRDLYVVILDLSTDGTISVAYPTQAGADVVIKPDLNLSHTFSTFVPRGRPSVTDVLKVFVSYKPLDLTPLTQGAIRGTRGESDPLQDLLDDSVGLSRNIASADKPVDLGTWATLQRVLLVKRKR